MVNVELREGFNICLFVHCPFVYVIYRCSRCRWLNFQLTVNDTVEKQLLVSLTKITQYTLDYPNFSGDRVEVRLIECPDNQNLININFNFFPLYKTTLCFHT